MSFARETVRTVNGASRIARFIAVTACLLSTFAVVNFSNVRANAVTWTPSSLGSSLALWLDADDASTITSSAGLVSEWRDKSGNNRDATQADPNSRPSTNGSGLTFNSSNKFMTGVMNPNTMATSVQVTVVFTRACCGANGYDSHPFTLTSNNYPTPYDGYNDTLLVGGPTGAYWGGGGFVNISSRTTRTLLSTSMSATKVAQYINGTLQNSVEGNFPYQQVSSIYHVATRFDRYTHFTGEINEIVVTSELSNANRSNLEAYLGSKWAVAGAPTTTTPPTTTTSTTTTTTTVAPATTTTLGPPKVSAVATGETAVQVDGVATKSKVTRENNQLVVSAGSLKATIGGLDENGAALPLDSDGNVRLKAGDVVRVKLAGFTPGGTVEAWLFSTPVLMGSAVVRPDGSVIGNFKIPANTPNGSHRIVIVSKSKDGKPTSFTVGVALGEVAKSSTLTRVLIAIPIALAIGIGFLIPNQLRRRRKVISQ